MERRKPTMWRLVHTMIAIGAVTVSLAGFQGLAAGSQSRQTVTLQIDGVTCAGCVKDVKTALVKVPGVSEVEFSTGKKWVVFPDYSNARASVTFDPEKTSLEALIKAVEAAGNPLSKYKAEVLIK
jgi:copper chaperone CopZ